MRNTSPVGWIPLLLVKVIYDGSFKPFFLSLFIVAIPIIVACVILDSLYYSKDGDFEIVVTSYNFLKVNVV